jgi:hypothetical protein
MPHRPAAVTKTDTRLVARARKRHEALHGDEGGGHASLNARTVADVVYETVAMPRRDHDLIGSLKWRLAQLKRPTDINELVSAGLNVLAGLPDDYLLATLADLPPIAETASETLLRR